MKRTFFILLNFVFILSFPARAFDSQEQYLLTCKDTGVGGIEQALSGEYPLIYNANATQNTESALWIITEETTGKYSIKNAQTGKYICYTPENTTEKYVSLVNQLNGNYTLFYVDAYQGDYYTICSVQNQNQFVNKRKTYPYPVGTYAGGSRTDNELFLIRSKSELGKIDSAPFYDLFESFTLNNKNVAVDKKENELLYSIPLSMMNGTNVTQTVRFEPKEATYTVKIDGEEITNGTNFIFQSVNAESVYTIEVSDNTTVLCVADLMFTGLPIVQLYSENPNFNNESWRNTEFSSGNIKVYEPNKITNPELLNCVLRHRGASALSFNKKPFAIKLQTETGESLDQSFFNLRNDNYWILDAMTMDKSRMRNRVGTDLWNDFSSDPYYKDKEKKLINGTRGQYVELFLNDEYWGLYCLTERIDRKQLKLKKLNELTAELHGVLYKSSQWSYEVMMGYRPDQGPGNALIEDYYNQSETWARYEVKYPDLEDGEPVDWQPLYDAVTFVAKSNDNTFKQEVASRFDLPVWTDYYLMMELILATDNHGKNAYFHIYDIKEEQKFSITPWDMDGVFGIRWDASKQYTQATQDYTDFIIEYEHGEHNLFRRLKELNAENFNDKLDQRYNEITASGLFTPESIAARFTNYKEQFEKSGAAAREINRWDKTLNFDEELNYLIDWIYDRTDYLNRQYNKYTDIENKPTASISIEAYPNPVTDKLYLKNLKPGTMIALYSETGVCLYVCETKTEDSQISFSGYSPGRYYLKTGNTGKIIMKK